MKEAEIEKMSCINVVDYKISVTGFQSELKKIENCKSYRRKKRKTAKNVDFRTLPRIYGEMRRFFEKSSSIKKSLSSKVERELQKSSSIPPIGRKINRKKTFFRFFPIFRAFRTFFLEKIPAYFLFEMFPKNLPFSASL